MRIAHRRPCSVILLLLWTPIALASARAISTPSAATDPSLRTAAPIRTTTPAFRPCRLEHPSRIAAFAAECATLRVPEDPLRPTGRTIELSIARVAAISRRKAADPLFLIAGGPGMGTQAMYPVVAAAFARIGRDRDLVLVDQRGTGGSAPLACEFDEDDLSSGDPSIVPELTRHCLASLEAAGRDLRPYTTSVAVLDLERVRVALGYERINLYGVSYGTRVAQHYLRRFPQQTRSVILDGVVPPGLALGPAMALDAEAALQRILARCRGEAPCRAAFDDPAQDYRALRAALETAPVDLTVADPATAAPRRMRFTARHLGAVLRLASYADSQASLLPVALHEARAKRNFTPLAGLFLMSTGGLRDAIAYGMHNTVVCSEDIPYVDERGVDRARLAATYLGTDLLDTLRGICGVWPRGPGRHRLPAAAGERRAGAAALRQRRSGDTTLRRRRSAAGAEARASPRRRRRGPRSGRRDLHGPGHRRFRARRRSGQARCELPRARAAGAVLHQPRGAGAVIEARRLAKRFGAVQAVRDVSFMAPDGRITGLLGPNGAGKSTSLRMLCTVLRPDGGAALIDGVDVAQDPLAARRRIGVLSHAAGLYPHLTGRENILYFGELHGMTRAARERRADELIELLDMPTARRGAPRASRKASA
jgi:pimeloyl-ACP methyl ester carboxylesterase